MLNLKKIWTLVKTHWYVPVIIALLIVMKGKSDNLKKIIEAQRKSYENQIKEIEEIHARRIEKDKQIHKDYEVAVKKIEEDYKKRNVELSTSKKKQVKKLVKKYYDKPNDLANRLSDKFGVVYVHEKNNSSDS